MIANNVTTTNFVTQHGDITDVDVEDMRANNVVGTNYNLDTVVANNVTTTNFDSRHGYVEDIDLENMRANNVVGTNYNLDTVVANNVTTTNFILVMVMLKILI